MKSFWAQQGKRINALTLRERTIMFVSLAVAMAALADALVLSPQGAQQKALASKMRQQATELDGLRRQLVAGTAAAGADTPLGRLQRLRAERQAVDEQIRQHAGKDAARLPELLAQVLKRHDKLVVLRLATAVPRAPAEADAAAALPQLGVDLSLAGSYLDLVAYLAEIESTLPGVRWSELQISQAEPTPVLKLRVYLLADPGVGT
jgi:MSHA biogenesis protein MshJ